MDTGNASAQAASTQSTVRGGDGYLSAQADRAGESHGDFARWENVYFLPVGDVLGKHHFLKQMEREKRRSDRSKAPLSIILFRLEARKPGDFGGVEAFLRLLHHSRRDTDILGYLRDDLVALLLPDTDEKGAHGFMRKIESRIGRFPASTISGTYPDQLFDQISTEPKARSNLSPFYIAGSKHGREPGYFLKRSLDIVGAIAGLVLLSPLMVATAIAVALDSPGPIFFRQARLGRGGVPFRFYKFRSMFVNADDRIHREFVTKLIQGKLEEVNQGDADNPYYKIKSDPRVTRVGTFIRDKSIDELPQLFNVLRGDMSLVGPRPPLPYEVESYESWHLMRILEVKPGITGLWQVEGHSTTTFDDMVRLDLRYIRNCSLILDLKILFKTVKMLLRWG